MIRCTVERVEADGSLVLDFGADEKGREQKGKMEVAGGWIPYVLADAQFLLVFEDRGIVVYAGSAEIERKFLSLPVAILEALQLKRVVH